MTQQNEKSTIIIRKCIKCGTELTGSNKRSAQLSSAFNNDKNI